MEAKIIFMIFTRIELNDFRTSMHGHRWTWLPTIIDHSGDWTIIDNQWQIFMEELFVKVLEDPSRCSLMVK